MSLRSLSLAAALLLSTPVLAQDTPSPDMIVATVNGTDITLGHMILVQSGLPEQYQQLPDEVLLEGILDQLISQTLLSTAPEATDTQRVTMAMDNERRALRAAEAAQAIANDAVSEESVQALYDEQFANAEPAQEFNASHILVETQEEAQAIAEQIRSGADFAETAQEKSTGPSGPSGGALGWFGAGQMVPEFEQAVREMEVGAVSDPVQTQFGWHVITLNETRDLEPPSLDQVRPQIEAQLQQQAVEARLEALTEGAEVTRNIEGLDPALLRDMSLFEN